MAGLQDKRLLAALAGGIVLVAVVAAALLLQGGEVRIVDAYATATPAVIGVYLTIENGTGEEVCIVGAELREQVEGKVRVELHATSEEEGIYRMYPVEEICIGPGETLEMRHGPGSYHIMIMGEVEAIDQIMSDGVVQITVIFDNGERVDIDAPIVG